MRVNRARRRQLLSRLWPMVDLIEAWHLIDRSLFTVQEHLRRFDSLVLVSLPFLFYDGGLLDL